MVRIDATLVARIAAVLAVFLMQAPDARAQDDGWLEAVAMDGATGAPAEGVRIELGAIAGSTDAAGYLRLCVPGGDHPLRIDGSTLEGLQTVLVVPLYVTELIVTLTEAGPAAMVDAPPRELLGEATETVETGPVAQGVLRGVARSEETGDPVAGAQVFIRGYAEDIVSDAEGRFEVTLDVGQHDVSVLADGFSVANARGVEVAAEAPSEVEIVLPPAAVALESYSVRAPRLVGGAAELLMEQKELGAVSNIIGAEQFKRSGDSSAADALKRVPGLSVVDGRFVFVRGLGERYSATDLNRTSLPSPEPERRVVPLDLIPANLLDSVVIQKSYLPDQPGEFGGGVVQLRTLNYPSEPLFSIRASAGARIGTTFQQGLDYQGGTWDWLGFDDGTRALPEEVAAASADQQLLESDMFSDRGFTPEELEAFGERMPNIWNTSRKTIPPDTSLGLSLGNRFMLGDRPLGLLLALDWGRSYTNLEEERTYYNQGAGGELEKFHSYEFETLEDRVKGSGLANVAFEFAENNTIGDRILLNRISDDTTREYGGLNRDVGDPIRLTRLQWVERTLLSNQVYGEHAIPPLAGLEIDWRFAYSQALRYEPDRREYRYDLENGTDDKWILSDRPEGNQRLYSTLVDNHYDLQWDVRMPFVIGDRAGFVGAGGQAVKREREFDTRRYAFAFKGGAANDTDIRSQDLESIFSPENIAPGNFQLEEVTQETDFYMARQRLEAAYVLADVPLHHRLRIVGGPRVERSRQDVKTYERFNPDDEPSFANLDNTDLLFGTNVLWDWTDVMGLRFAAARTTSRPNFRELSPAARYEVTGGRLEYGNADLERAILWHADARWDWYMSPGELLSVGVFYKRLQNPIETVVQPSAQLSVTWENATAADNLGVEIEARKNFGFITPALADFQLGANASFIHSRVDLSATSGIETSKQRALQGQSPYLINLILSYDHPDKGVSLNVLYNVFGTRIMEVGAQGMPDTYEMPVHLLDFTYRQRLGKGFELAFVASNLIDSRREWKQGDSVVSTYRKGRKFTLKLTWTAPPPGSRRR